MVDLSTRYLGLELKNPLVASASPLSKKLDGIRRLEDAGVSAVVMYSLFEEQIVHESLALDHYLTRGSDSFAEALTYFPDLGRYNVGPEGYLELIRKAKESVGIPIIGSLNGVSSGGWIEYARLIQEAGADALELNLYYLPTDPALTAAELEANYVGLVADIHKQIRIPLAVKLSPFFTALPHFAQQMVQAGAKGLVLFNRFYQPDFDIETLEVVPSLVLSTSEELRLPLRWIAILYGRVAADMALSSGVHTGQDVIKALMAGAKVAMTTSALLKHGLKRAGEILQEMQAWMETFEYQSVQQMIGSMSQQAVAEPAAFERANYMKALLTYDNRLIY
ncbi:dihydroorotate dehydrogenase [Thermanaerothrix daxensis]|uniref:Dihydroorotate dehydrogenase n=1 Tax=Thermanaerothrix daxensis TaxID=869279 RepID=A0A0P6YBB9_9CHLR|nr:dihydroorotate dehydrogenase-like protein [Thermanaerothrix daxensis]KPL82452.1 dihydroorotate dehydrogenase [Thermanaerothrix daxensis]